MNELLGEFTIVLALAAPWLGIVCLRRQRASRWLLPLVPLPLVLLAVLGEARLSMPALLLGMEWQVDSVNRPLLLLAGLGWSLAGAWAATRQSANARRFALFWLLTLAGQALALLAMNLASFYAGYVLMTLAAFGLVVHAGSTEAWRAGRVYLVLALLGEALLLAGLTMLASAHGNVAFSTLAGLQADTLGLAPVLMLLGFAVKMGVVPLHVWLPLAHPVAPIPASAVLSGILVKAGLLGMLRMVPPEALPWPSLLFALGLFTAAYAAVVGLSQRRLKTVLAYSTISQMGLLLALLAALPGSDQAAVVAAAGLFALHHGLNKIALFLGAGSQPGADRWRALLFLLPALALIGVPLSSGALGKDALKLALDAGGFGQWLMLLGVSSLLTALLLLHAWRLASHLRHARDRVHPALPLTVLAGLLLPWLWAWHTGQLAAPSLAGLGAALWPLLLALLLHRLWRRRRRASRLFWPKLPEGDLVQPMERCIARLASSSLWDRVAVPGPPLVQFDADKVRRWLAPPWLDHLERVMLRLPVAGACLLLLVFILLVLGY